MKTINGYKLTQRLKKIRSETYLSATDQALYHELVSICNEKRWPEVFSVKNDPLAASLNVTVKTMIKSRKTLTGCDLIFSSSQKDKRYGCIYSFVRHISSVKFTDDITT